MVNKDFLKQVFRDEKKLLPLADVKYVNMPHYDELSVKKYWPILREDETFMKYMPDLRLENRLPESKYFWNVANTVQSAYVCGLLKHSNDQRMNAQSETDRAGTIEISEQWWDKLNSVPFVSCKY